MRADGVPVERLLDVETRPLLGVFLPDRLELVKGPPALRRAHVDQFVTALWPTRITAKRAYSRALVQRNALLAGIRAGRASRATLPTWDIELARSALQLRENRAAAVDLLLEPFTQRAGDLGLAGGATLQYRPRSRAVDVQEFVRELEERLPTDLERGFGTHGPHRDELVFLRDKRELRAYGSQGEQRLVLLALLLAERDVISTVRDRIPLMLLDDVMSELDSQRREFLATELSRAGQSLITTTDLSHVPGSSAERVRRLAVSQGAILAEAQVPLAL